jgi:hypothetical protein
MVTGTITQIGLAATWNLLNESGPSSRESCRRSLVQVYRRQNREQIAHSDPSDREIGRRCSSVLLNATKSNSDFWPFWNRDLLYRLQNGGSNGLEGSKDCRSVGGHGNQHVRLRSAQISLSGVTCPVQEANFAFELRQAPSAAADMSLRSALRK